MTRSQPWTFVLSEYLDLPFVMRRAGEPVVSVRSEIEAIDCLRHWSPRRIVVDMQCYGAQRVIDFARERIPGCRIEPHETVISQLLAS